MSKAWKRFLIQWIVPVGIFAIVMVFIIASFKAKITQTATQEYDSSLVKATEDYASGLCSAIQKSEAVTKAVVDTFPGTFDADVVTKGLESIANSSDAYLVVYCENLQNGIANNGETIDLSKLSYVSQVMGENIYEYSFVADDEIVGKPAIIVRVPVEGKPANVLTFYPLDTTSVKSVVSVERDYDSAANAIIADTDGAVISSTNKTDGYQIGKNVWDSLFSENAESNIRRVKTKAQSGNSGTFDASVGKINSIVCYAPIPGTGRLLFVAYNQKNVDRAIAKSTASSLKQLSLVVAVLVVFILAILTINIVQSSADNRNKEELKDKADNDLLTGLKNKIATEREIKEYMKDYPDSIGMLFLIDIDNFKKINDTMGHAFGDEVLREIGRHIGVNFRVSDVIGRVGGDEFMVFLKNLKEDANTIREAQKLIYFFRHFQVGDYVKYSVTASIGAAVFPAHGTDFESLYKSADAAVYKSKKRGKNQLSFFDDRDKTPEEVQYADSHQISIERKSETPIES